MTHQFTPIDSDLIELLNKTYVNFEQYGCIRVDGVFMAESYKKFADAIENFEVRDDDIWVCSFPKTGTTWTQEMVWCIANDLDFEGAKVLLNDRFPFVEATAIVDLKETTQPDYDMKMPEYLVNSIHFVANLPSPRFIKTHLPFNLLPRQLRNGETKAKIVYVVRNAKDTCIIIITLNSFYLSKETSRIFAIFSSEMQFKDIFEQLGTIRLKTLPSAPFWKHVLSYWGKRINDNILFLKYEDMKKDLPSVLMKTAKFLGKNLTTDQLAILTKHLSFASMKANSAVNNADLIASFHEVLKTGEKGEFMRNGNVDQWKTVMSPEYIKLFDDWTRENLEGTRLYF